jgi:hypothetical protein
LPGVLVFKAIAKRPDLDDKEDHDDNSKKHDQHNKNGESIFHWTNEGLHLNRR